MAGLRIEGLSVGYGTERVLHDLSLTTQGVLILMGPSGGGKTTLLLSLLGVLKPLQGHIFLNEEEISSKPIEARNIGYLPQDYGLFPHLNVYENVSFGLRVRGIPRAERDPLVTKWLEMVGLPGKGGCKIAELSGGEKQRVGLARALAVRPSLLLLDEPLSSIDQTTKFEVATSLKTLFAQLTIPTILVTHSHEEASFFPGEVAILLEGKIAQIGPFETLLHHPHNPSIRRLLHPYSYHHE